MEEGEAADEVHGRLAWEADKGQGENEVCHGPCLKWLWGSHGRPALWRMLG